MYGDSQWHLAGRIDTRQRKRPYAWREERGKSSRVWTCLQGGRVPFLSLSGARARAYTQHIHAAHIQRQSNNPRSRKKERKKERNRVRERERERERDTDLSLGCHDDRPVSIGFNSVFSSTRKCCCFCCLESRRENDRILTLFCNLEVQLTRCVSVCERVYARPCVCVCLCV